ncbi:replication protein A 70 kDa DNA-binding subunit B-like [Tasmannia lanceolata]|uniref:replication protein A 70 kDa DNA-binding subunit B-like n=1 Tax=Tasmannia lanceolata TaxID=3420 RepID=UPI0040647B6D
MKDACQRAPYSSDYVDILGVLLYVSNVWPLKPKNSSATIKRELVLIHESCCPIMLSLWASETMLVTENLATPPNFHTVILAMAVKPVQYQGGLSLSTTRYTTVKVNPDDAGAEKLLPWLEYSDEGCSITMRTISSSSSAAVTSALPVARRINVFDLDERLEADISQATYYRITDTLHEIDADYFQCYIACLSCNKKIQETDIAFQCDNCGKYGDIAIPRYVMGANIVDGTGMKQLTFFNDEAEHLLGLFVADFRKKLLEGQGQQKEHRVLSDPGFLSIFAFLEYSYCPSRLLEKAEAFLSEM